MFRRRHFFPEPLFGQARAALCLAEASVRFFQSPSEANAFAAAERSKAESADRRRAVEAVKASRHPRRRQALALLRLLGDFAEHVSWGTAEAHRFEAASAAGLRRMALGLRQALASLAAAIAVAEDRSLCESRLLAAKRQAGEVEGRHRLERDRCLEEPNVVAGLKAAAVARRFSQAAEAVSAAADLLGETALVEAA